MEHMLDEDGLMGVLPREIVARFGQIQIPQVMTGERAERRMFFAC